LELRNVTTKFSHFFQERKLWGRKKKKRKEKNVFRSFCSRRRFFYVP